MFIRPVTAAAFMLLTAIVAQAQTSKTNAVTVNTIMELEDRVAIRKLTEELNKVDAAGAGTSVPPILPMGSTPSASGQSVPPIRKERTVSVDLMPVTEAIYGVRPDYMADVRANGRLYPGVRKGSALGMYSVMEVTGQGVMLERLHITGQKGKQRTDKSLVFAPMQAVN